MVPDAVNQSGTGKVSCFGIMEYWNSWMDGIRKEHPEKDFIHIHAIFHYSSIPTFQSAALLLFNSSK